MKIIVGSRSRAQRAVPGHRHLIFEEGTQSAWPYERLARHVQEIVVTGVIRSRGPKSDRVDAYALAARVVTTKLYAHYDFLLDLKKQAEQELIGESHKHPIARILETAPGIGPIRAARLLPVVVTPHRFRTRRQFWSYCGLGIVMRSTSDWVRNQTGQW